MAELIVSFCCNDPRNGLFNDECAGVQVEDDGEVIVSFMFLDVPMAWDGDVVTLDKEQFRVRGCVEWVGNWCWNQTRMATAEAERLVRWLLANAGSADQWNPDHPLGGIIEKEVHAA